MEISAIKIDSSISYVNDVRIDLWKIRWVIAISLAISYANIQKVWLHGSCSIKWKQTTLLALDNLKKKNTLLAIWLKAII